MNVEPELDASTLGRIELNRGIRRLLDGLDLHVPGEAAHADRVAVHAVACGEALMFSDLELLQLRCAAELHDIGKLMVPAEYLRRGEALTATMRVEVEKHAALGEAVIRDALPGMPYWFEDAIPLVTDTTNTGTVQGIPRWFRAKESLGEHRSLAAARHTM